MKKHPINPEGELSDLENEKVLNKKIDIQAKILDLETAALLRDEIVGLTKKLNSGK